MKLARLPLEELLLIAWHEMLSNKSITTYTEDDNETAQNLP